MNKKYKCETVQERLEDMSVRRADCVFGPSLTVAASTSKRTGREISVIESPFLQDNITANESQYSVLVSDKSYLLTYGSLCRLKGLQVIGESIYDILDKYPDLFYIFCGKDNGIVFENRYYTGMEYLTMCAANHSDRIIYLGRLSQGDLYPVIVGAKAIILPSRIDNLPNACIEAMYFKKPVVGTYGASYDQLIADGKSGFLIDRDDSYQLKSKIDTIMSMSEDELRQIGENARLRLNKMRPEVILEKLLDVYNTAINKNS